MDAHTTQEWRSKGFTSVTENTATGDFNNSILLEMLEAKRRQPLPVGEYHAEETGLTCPATRRELGGFLDQHPNRGMPFDSATCGTSNRCFGRDDHQVWRQDESDRIVVRLVCGI